MAADVSARVHLVAEKLQQKAQDAQRKGNENAARALSASVSDLRQAMALISEQRHLLTRRRGEGDEEEDDADVHVQELATRLARVEAMLGKKSDDMKSKGNENAAAALQQSATAVDKGRSLLIEQQQTIFGLLGRWEKLEDVVSGKRGRRRSSVATNDGEEEEDQEMDTPHGRLIAQVRHLVQLGTVVKEIFPECQEVEKVKEEMEKLKDEEKEIEELRKELKRAEEDTLEAQEILKQESLALEGVKQEMQRMKEKEIQRQEEDDALLEQQREACQAMEQLVREGDQEIQRMTQSATTQAEEMQSLRIEIESLVTEKERQERTHTGEIEGLQAQLASAIDALSSKTDEGVASTEEKLQGLQVQLENLMEEKNTHADEVEKLRLQLKDAKASLAAAAEENALSNDEELQSLRIQIETLNSEKEKLVKLHEVEMEKLHVTHTQEIEDLRQQLDDSLNDPTKREETLSNDTEELQSRLAALTDEMERLLQSHAEEIDEIKLTHLQQIEKIKLGYSQAIEELELTHSQAIEELELKHSQEIEDLELKHSRGMEELKLEHSQKIQELHQRIESDVSNLSTEEEGVDVVTEDLQSLQTKVDSLLSEKDALVKEHLDEIEELKSKTEDLQSLRDTLNTLTSEKNQLENSHANELEKLRADHQAEIESLRHHLAEISSNTRDESASHADELQQLRAEVGALTIEKDHLVKEHAVEIEKLHYEVENVRSDPNHEAGDQVESNVDMIGENGVPVMELEEDQCSGISAEDEVDTSSNGGDEANLSQKESEMQALDVIRSQLAGYEEKSQAQQDKISKLEQEQADYEEKIGILTSEKAQALEELQHAHEAEVLRLQASLDTLEAQVAEYEDHYQAQQATITSFENEQVELQKRIELLTDQQAHAVDKLQNSHEKETTRLTQCVADNEGTIESLSEQLEELKTELAEKSAEQSETAEALGRCETELRSSRMELDAQVLECSKLKSDLEIQDTQNAISGEVEQCLSKLAAELDEMTRNMDIEAMQELMIKKWQSREVANLCSSLVPVVSELASAQDQLHKTEEQLKLTGEERDSLKLILEQFVKTVDMRLFTKDDEEEHDVLEVLASGEDVREYLVVAQTNVARWLEELRQLHDRIEEDTSKLSVVNEEKLQTQERLATLEDSKHDLEVLVESLKEQLVDMRTTTEKLKAQNHSASIQEQQQQTARQEEIADLQQQLASVRGDFERYRTRSHTALKKMEKRAELLNGMRKENEVLLQQIKESNEQRDEAESARQESEARLLEVQRAQETMQADFDEFAKEKARVIVELEEERQEREQIDTKMQELRLKIQQLEAEKKQVQEENERIQEAEQAAFQARLNTATAAVQTAKQDLQKVHDALEASKAENDRRKKLIESLELKLEEEANAAASDTNNTPAPPSVSAPTPLVASGLEKELTTLRASEMALRRQLDDARADLIGLQERFATTKAANAEKVFALEEQVTHWTMELAAANEEVRRLNSFVQAQKSSSLKPRANGAILTASKNAPPAESSLEQSQQELPSSTRVQALPEELRGLKTELQDANTEISLLSRALDASREELQEARDQIDALAPSLSEPESGEDSSGMSKAAKVLAAKDEALKKLRVQVLELQEELQTIREEKSALELELEKEELDDLQTSRKHIQSEKERAMQLQRRQTLVSSFEKKVTTIVDELQQRLEDHSTAFREVCDFRDDHRAVLFDQGEARGKQSDEPEFEECLVMRSGVVIKAGASFQLPVICEKAGWRVVWNFSVKEDAADVSFKLFAMTSTEVEVVSPERMNEMSGVFQVRHDNTTLMFEWDNSFSWLNEKTLDYHVSIQEPLTVQAQKVRHSERELETKAKLLEDGLALIQVENQRRSELSATLQRLSECEATKEKHLAEFEARKTEVLDQKTRFQEEMDVQKAGFAAMLREQDELEDVERSITRAWASAVAEREDVEMTLQLAGNGAQLETLAHEMEEQVKVVAQQLKDPKPVEDSGDVEAEISTPQHQTKEEQQHSGEKLPVVDQ
ncbi:hypothetical protein P3T76_004072 [Phytophthora citrophthora]|uniref:GOLD domain-containing protein n=1 Tax=Phytophthora citrophthora TaxID=4793 RepID=A0AAD9GT99_9STRA|nr:hypothetical protein P3T76_004072 [Phytophthora citrophthora]